MFKRLSICLLIVTVAACSDRNLPPQIITASSNPQPSPVELPREVKTTPTPQPDLVRSVPSATLSGRFQRTPRTEYTTYALTLVAGPKVVYTVEGESTSELTFSQIFSYNFNGVRVAKIVDDGTIYLKNDLQERRYRFYGKRSSSGHLAGLSIAGTFYRGFIVDDQIELENLIVDGHRSKGVIDYFHMNGHYVVEEKASFGKYSIQPDQLENMIMNYDTVVTNPITHVFFRFGDLKVTGKIIFTDNRCQGCPYEDPFGAGVDLHFTRKDGRPLRVFEGVEKSTSDEDQLRAFLAFFQIISRDL